MRILVTGAYGLIGGYVVSRLLEDGHAIVGVGRSLTAAQRRFPAVRWVRGDLRRMTVTNWAPLLDGVDAVVNCAGALQDSPRDDVKAVHVAAVSALAAACVACGVRRFVQISAAGVDDASGAFFATKRAADLALQASDLDWVVLRPGLVLAPAAYGGSALLRGLAAFPLFMPAVSPDALVQVVSVDDVAEAVARSVRSKTPARFTCDLVSAEPTRLRDLLVALRAWLGLAPAPVVGVPAWIGLVAASVADALAWFGWRSPMRTTAIKQLAKGVTGSPAEAQSHLNLAPRFLSPMLSRWPSGVQERWYAKLYFAKPLVLATLAVFWATSGAIGLVNAAAAVRILTSAAIPAAWSEWFVLGGSLVDLALAGLVCFRGSAPLALRAMILVTASYLAAATLKVPALWLDPLGPLVKSIPAAVLALAALAVMDER